MDETYVAFGPNSNCTLDVCDISFTVYKYRPSLPANAILIALFGLAMILHIAQGIRWRTWVFLVAMVWGCISEMLGYGGRIMLWNNPFSFTGFMTQIVCITLGPAFFSAAIYLTLSKIVVYLGVQYSRLSPSMYYWIFISCDIISLTLQATGGAMSTTSSGSSQTGVNIAIAGLTFQVFTLTVFILFAIDFAIRYARGRARQSPATKLETSFKVFVGFLSLAVLLILIRCIYRIDELSEGYSGPLISNEGLFIGLEGVMIIVATFALNVAHPGPVFQPSKTSELDCPETETAVRTAEKK